MNLQDAVARTTPGLFTFWIQPLINALLDCFRRLSLNISGAHHLAFHLFQGGSSRTKRSPPQ